MSDFKRKKVIGVGREGIHILNQMIEKNQPSTIFVALDNDKDTLAESKADLVVQLSGEDEQIDKCLIGDYPGYYNQLKRTIAGLLKDTDALLLVGSFSDLVFADLAPLIADISRAIGILTAAVIDRSINTQGAQQFYQAVDESRLEAQVDSLLVYNHGEIIKLNKDRSM
jgi:cell division GTPase FtsZ